MISSSFSHLMEIGWMIEFRLSPSLSSKKVRFLSNVPRNGTDPFRRDEYEEFRWESSSNVKSDDFHRFIRFRPERSGTFHYYFTIDGTMFVHCSMSLNENWFFLVF